MNLKDLFKTNKLRFIAICLLVAIEILCATSVTYFMTPAFNYIKQNKLNIFLIFIIFSAALQLLDTILQSINMVLYNQQVQDYIHNIRNNISRYFFHKSEEKVAEIQNDLDTNMQELTSKYTTPLLVLGRRILTILFSIGVLFTFNWSLVVLTLLLSFIGLYLRKIFEQVTSSATFEVTKKNEQLLNTIGKWAQGLSELRRYASLKSYKKAIQNSTSELKNATIKDCYWGNWATAATSFVSLLGIALLLFLSIYLYATGQIVFGAVITSGIFANQIMNSVTYLADSINQIKSSKKLRQEISKLQQPVEFTVPDNSAQNIAHIEVSDLQVSFKNGENISYPHIQINKGEKVLLSGDSGVGKTTLFKVLLGQIKPKRGQIIYKNEQGQSFMPDLERIGYIAQDNTLFPDTIENNITMFDTKLTGKVTEAIKKVKLDKDIKKFPAGVKTMVDLDHGNISGGQKQKIVLARADIHNSDLLLIDEGTSAIDSKATKEILKEILKSDRTIIMIAHNLSQEMIAMFDYKIDLRKMEVN